MVRESPGARNQRLSYRPDIDGLRAIAVAGVVIYHAPALGAFPGGYLGVDVFFVISGFLIASVIMGAQENGAFSYREFYLRRARRLLPAFISVSMATSAVAWVILGPTELLDFSKSLLASIVGVSNIYFAGQDPYWAVGSAEQPFLHTWSLSVEEQFYLLFPALMVLSLNLLGKVGRLRFFSVIGLLSLATAIWLTQVNPTYSFYFLPTRAWELLIGVTLALILSQWRFEISKPKAGILSGLGVTLVGASFVFGGQFITGPSFPALVPTIGAALVILGGTAQNPVSDVLGIKPFVGLGLVSYSLYLWHYPILALGGIAGGLVEGINAGGGAGLQLVGICLALGLAVLTYFWVEVPFRRGRWPPARRISIATAVVLTGAFGLASLATNGYTSSSAIPAPVEAHLAYEGNFLEPLEVENPTGTMLVFGDSHMQTLLPGLSESARASGLRFIDGARHSCLFAPGLELEADPDWCGPEVQQTRLSEARKNSPAFIVLGGRYPLALEGTRFDNGEGGVESGDPYRFQKPGQQLSSIDTHAEQLSAATLLGAQTLLRQGHVLVLVYPIPEAGWQVPEQIKPQAVLPRWIPERIHRLEGIKRLAPASAWPLAVPLTTSFSTYLERTRSSFEVFDRITGVNVVRVYPHELFCEEETDRCRTHSDTNVFYSDDDHLSLSGANLVTREIMSKITSLQGDADPL